MYLYCILVKNPHCFVVLYESELANKLNYSVVQQVTTMFKHYFTCEG